MNIMLIIVSKKNFYAFTSLFLRFLDLERKGRTKIIEIIASVAALYE